MITTKQSLKRQTTNEDINLSCLFYASAPVITNSVKVLHFLEMWKLIFFSSLVLHTQEDPFVYTKKTTKRSFFLHTDLLIREEMFLYLRYSVLSYRVYMWSPVFSYYLPLSSTYVNLSCCSLFHFSRMK